MKQHILIVDGRFYKEISEELVRGATAALDNHDITYDIIHVPGAFEIPGAIRMAMNSGKYDGYIALGCVIRGETSHYDYVCGESARGLQELVLQHQVAIGYGILTCENEEQVWARAALNKGNKGAAAAEACMRMMALKAEFGVK